MHDSTQSPFRISVRDFVAPLAATGSLVATAGGPGRADALVVGTQAHTRLQESRLAHFPGVYRKEVPLAWRLTSQDAALEVGGRCDGIYGFEHEVVIEEIKSTAFPRRLLRDIASDDRHPAALQVRMYAWMFHETRNSEDARPIRCRLVVVSHADDEEAVIDVSFDAGSFGIWARSRGEAWEQRRRDEEAWQAMRRKIAQDLQFPFASPRAGQRELLERVERCVESGGRLLVQAPTGLGKTAAVLFPALRHALATGKQVFYITPRNTQHKLAHDVMARLHQQGMPVRSVIITSKEKSCLRDEPLCHPQMCPFADGYYDKLTTHRVLDAIWREGPLDAQILARWAREHEVCPFELSLDVTRRADVIICDYNYVFSPQAALARYFDDPDRARDLVLVIDEAHNLHERAVTFYSPELSRTFVDETARNFDTYLPADIARRVKRLVTRARKCLAQACPAGTPAGRVTLEPGEFFAVEARLVSLLSTHAERADVLSPRDPLLVLTRAWMDFCEGLRRQGKEFFHSREYQSGSGERVKVTCCDASKALAARLRNFASVVAFSATFKPFGFYARVSGFEENDTSTVEFPSPFPSSHRHVLVIPQISTAYRHRGERTFVKIGEALSRIFAVRKGNYFAFFPSFRMLEDVAPHIDLPEFRVIAQTRGMKPGEVEDTLRALRSGPRNVVILAVQGGVFSEGVDYPGDMLIGVAVVGPALPVYGVEREGVRDYFERRYGSGFEYAYVNPAMARAVQAAGRVIRTETDKGLIVLMDGRFLQPNYAAGLPREWLENETTGLVSSSILNDVRNFWEKA